MSREQTANLRVLHVLDSRRRRGAEVFAQDLVASLAGAGVSQRVVVLDGRGGELSFDAPMSDLSRNGGRGVEAKVVRALRDAARDWSPDIVQAHGGDTLKYSALAGLGRSTALVHRAIGMAPRWIRRGPRRRIYGWLIGRATKVVALADAVARDYIKLFQIPNDRILTIPNAVDPARLVPVTGRSVMRDRLGIPQASPVILSILALTWEKNPLAHIEVYERVLADHPDAIHLIAGEGPMRPDLEEVIERRGLTGRSRLLGSRDDVNELLDVSDVVLFASRADGMEGLPTIMIEAGIAGRPVVGYDLAGVGEIVIDGETGILARPRDVTQVIKGVSKLLADPELRQSMGRRARERCMEQFTIGPISSRYLDLYRSLAGRTPSARAESASR